MDLTLEPVSSLKPDSIDRPYPAINFLLPTPSLIYTLQRISFDLSGIPSSSIAGLHLVCGTIIASFDQIECCCQASFLRIHLMLATYIRAKKEALQTFSHRTLAKTGIIQSNAKADEDEPVFAKAFICNLCKSPQQLFRRFRQIIF
jgi:hypothetical protein